LMTYLIAIMLIVLSYVFTAEVVKRIFYNRIKL